MSEFNLKPPAQESDEDTMSYIERLDWEKSRIPKDLLHKPIVGAVATPAGIQHWRKATHLGPAGTGKEAQKLNPLYAPTSIDLTYTFGELPETKKRTDEQRLRVLSKALIEMAEASYKAKGYIDFPASIMHRMQDIYRSWGVHMTVDKIRSQTIDGIKDGLDGWAARLLNQAAPAKLTPVVGAKAAPVATGQKARR